MDHRYIEENNIADSYVLGKLSASERARFEEHYLDCAECLDSLESAEVFCQAVNRVMKREAVFSSAAPDAGLFGRMAQIKLRRQTALAASFIALLAMSLVVIAAQFVENRRLNRELTSANAASPAQPARGSVSVALDPSATEAGKKATPMVEPSPAASPFQQPVPSQRPARVEPMESFRELIRPQINVPIFTLGSVRSAEPNPSTSVNEIEVSRSPQWLIFSVELDEKSKHQTYRATILTADGRHVWEASGLQPNRYDALVLSFLSTFFQSRDYSIVLEGNTPDGRSVPVANYPFRITRKIP